MSRRPPAGRSRGGDGEQLTFSGLLIAAGMLAFAGGLLGLLGEFHWLLDLASNFRVQMLLVLSVAAGWCALRRRLRWAGLFLAGALVQLVLCLPLLWPCAPATPTDAPTRRLYLANVLSSNQRSDRLLASIRETEPDWIVLLEVNPRWESELSELRAHYPYGLREVRSDNYGIALYSRVEPERVEILDLAEVHVPTLAAHFVEPDGKRWILLATHTLPPANRRYAHLRDRHLDALGQWIASRHEPVVVAGDLNATRWSYPMRRLMKTAGLRNAEDGRGVHPTWHAAWGRLGLRLDHVLYRDPFRVASLRVLADVGSDHLPLIADLSLGE